MFDLYDEHVLLSAGGAFIDDTLQLGNVEALSTYIFGSRRSQRSLPAAQGGVILFPDAAKTSLNQLTEKAALRMSGTPVHKEQAPDVTLQRFLCRF
jgi:hypothetical protein